MNTKFLQAPLQVFICLLNIGLRIIDIMKRLMSLILIFLVALSCKSVSGPSDTNGGNGDNNGSSPPDTSSWVLLAEGTFSFYEWDLTGDTLCDTFVLSYPRDAYNDPEGSRLPLNETVYPGDILRVFGKYISGNDTAVSIAFAGDTSNPGSQELALAALGDTLSFPGDSAYLTMPNGQTVPISFYIVVGMFIDDLGGMRCSPNSTDSARVYYRLEKRR